MKYIIHIVPFQIESQEKLHSVRIFGILVGYICLFYVQIVSNILMNSVILYSFPPLPKVLKSVFSEFWVRTWVQAVSCIKTGLWLAGLPIKASFFGGKLLELKSCQKSNKKRTLVRNLVWKRSTELLIWAEHLPNPKLEFMHTFSFF